MRGYTFRKALGTLFGNGNGQGNLAMQDVGVEGEKNNKWSNYEKGIDVETYNCIGLAFRKYLHLNLDDFIDFLYLNNRRSEGEVGDIQIVLWTYTYLPIWDDLTKVYYNKNDDYKLTRDPTKTPLIYDEFHIVGGEITKKGENPINVYSKNGPRPVYGPADIYSWTPRFMERGKNNDSSDTYYFNTRYQLGLILFRINMTQTVYYIPQHLIPNKFLKP